jgi:hypothetical protein
MIINSLLQPHHLLLHPERSNLLGLKQGASEIGILSVEWWNYNRLLWRERYHHNLTLGLVDGIHIDSTVGVDDRDHLEQEQSNKQSFHGVPPVWGLS